VSKATRAIGEALFDYPRNGESAHDKMIAWGMGDI